MKINIGFINERSVFVPNVAIDNTPPIVRFEEQSIEGEPSKSEAIIRLSEEVKTIDGWTNYGLSLRKVFSNNVTYPLTLVDLAGNTIEILVDVKNASAISLEYGSYDGYSKQTLVRGGEISSPKTISTNSLCKTESIFIRTFGELGKDLLEGCIYMHISPENEALSKKCTYSKLSYALGYNPSSSAWWKIGSEHTTTYSNQTFTQFGGYGCNQSNTYLYGISGLEFRLQHSSELSVVYQSYVNGVGWLSASSDGEENVYQHDKPISSFRLNVIPTSQKQYLIAYWNRDVKTSITP